MAPILSAGGLGKSYGGVVALDDVSFDLRAGEVLAICGDNGAGKSTLIRILSGAHAPDHGTITLRGQPRRFASPHDALGHGIATIYQDLALAPRLSVAENVFMGAELTWGPILAKRRMRREAAGYLARLSAGVTDMLGPVAQLSGGQRQAVAIARALRWRADIIIMDEPTAALGVRETAQVLELIRKLQADGRSVLLISHDMRDVAAVASRVLVLGGGRVIAERAVLGLSADDLMRLVMGGKTE